MDYFIAEIREKELMSKGLSKCIAAFEYFDKALIVLSATSGCVFIASFASVIGAPIRIATAIFSFAFSLTTVNVKNYEKQHKIKRKNIAKLLRKPEVN